MIDEVTMIEICYLLSIKLGMHISYYKLDDLGGIDDDTNVIIQIITNRDTFIHSYWTIHNLETEDLLRVGDDYFFTHLNIMYEEIKKRL